MFPLRRIVSGSGPLVYSYYWNINFNIPIPHPESNYQTHLYMLQGNRKYVTTNHKLYLFCDPWLKPHPQSSRNILHRQYRNKLQVQIASTWYDHYYFSFWQCYSISRWTPSCFLMNLTLLVSNSSISPSVNFWWYSAINSSLGSAVLGTSMGFPMTRSSGFLLGIMP